MFTTPEIYLQAELQYHRDQIRGSFRRGWLSRQGTPVRHRSSSRLVRRTPTTSPASR
jgi:hypothetical protein